MITKILETLEEGFTQLSKKDYNRDAGKTSMKRFLDLVFAGTPIEVIEAPTVSLKIGDVEKDIKATLEYQGVKTEVDISLTMSYESRKEGAYLRRVILLDPSEVYMHFDNDNIEIELDSNYNIRRGLEDLLGFLSVRKKAVNEARSATQLRQELQAYGLDPSGKSRAEMEQALALAMWKESHPGEEFPDEYDPMLAKDSSRLDPAEVDKIFTSSKWMIQPKFDGMRVILAFNKGKIRATSRQRSVKDFMFRELTPNMLGYKDMKDPFQGRTVLDGELMSPQKRINTGATVTASKLQAIVALCSMEASKSLAIQEEIGKMEYVAYDILFFEGEDVQQMPYEDRQKLVSLAVERIKESNPDLPITASKTWTDYTSAWEIFKEYVGEGGEGIMLKARKGKYRQGARSPDLQKLKAFETIDGFISGSIPSTPGKGFENYIGGFEISAYVDGKPQVIANVSNIDFDTRKKATSYDSEGKPILNPEFLNRCVQLIGQEWSKNMKLGSARIDDWRDDKNPEDCKLSSADMQTKDR